MLVQIIFQHLVRTSPIAFDELLLASGQGSVTEDDMMGLPQADALQSKQHLDL